MKISKRQLRKIIKEEKAVLEQSWRENPAKIRRQRRIRDRQRMIDQMTFKQLKRRAFDSALFIQGRLDTGQYEYADIWEAEIPGLADTIDAAKVKAAEEGVTYDDIPEVRHQGGILDLSRYSLGGLPAGIEESKLRKIIRESLLLEAGDFSSNLKKIRALLDKDDFESAAKMYADMNEDPSYIAGEIEALIFDYDETADFFANADASDAEEFEDLVYGYVNEKEWSDHQNLPNKLEREVIGQALTQSFVLPNDFKEIEFQVRMRGGKPYNINIEDDNTLSNIGPSDLQQAGVSIEDVIQVLRDNGATERKKQKPIKRTPPMYD